MPKVNKSFRKGVFEKMKKNILLRSLAAMLAVTSIAGCMVGCGEEPAPAPVIVPSYAPAHSEPVAYNPGYPENEPESYYNQPYSYNSGDKY